MNDAADHLAIIDPGHAPDLIRQQRPEPLGLLLAQPKLADTDAPAIAERETHPADKENPFMGLHLSTDLY